MATVYSVRVAFVSVASPGAANIYTVPVDRVLVVRDISAVSVMTGSCSIGFYDVAGSAYFTFFTVAGPFIAQQWSGRAVFPAGTILAYNCTAGGWNALISGYLLDP